LSSLTMSGSPINVGNMLDNDALGIVVPPNSTIYVQYTVGGSETSNVGANVLQQVQNINYSINGNNESLIQGVISSTRTNNIISAIGGNGLPSVNEIKNYIAANFASQYRCVTVNDYVSRCFQMDGSFGVPFRIYGTLGDNKIKLYIICINGSGALISTSTSVIKNNLINYLSSYRMINDFVEILDGNVINISLQISLFIDLSVGTANSVKLSSINALTNYFDVNNWQMNQTIFISQVVEMLREVPGVINVVDIQFYNLIGGGYSNSIHPQSGAQTMVPGTGGFIAPIIPINNAIYGNLSSMTEVLNPNQNFQIRTTS